MATTSSKGPSGTKNNSFARIGEYLSRVKSASNYFYKKANFAYSNKGTAYSGYMKAREAYRGKKISYSDLQKFRQAYLKANNFYENARFQSGAYRRPYYMASALERMIP